MEFYLGVEVADPKDPMEVSSLNLHGVLRLDLGGSKIGILKG